MSDVDAAHLRFSINNMKETIAISILANAILSSSTSGEFGPRGFTASAEERLSKAVDIAKRVYDEKLK